MQENKGTFIVIEGTDGSGKGTQFALLTQRLRDTGYDVAAFDFPRYEEESSYFVRRYLNGAYGALNQIGPYTASLFYALDRYEAAPAIREALAAGKVVISNRFTGSSMGHQGTKLKHPEERRGYFIWLDNLEFQLLNIPRPDMSFVLRVPADIAQQLVDQKGERSYTDKKRDIHEADLEHMRLAVETYDDLCTLFPKDFTRIDCQRSGKLLSIDEISSLLWARVSPLLPTIKADQSTAPAPAAQRPAPADEDLARIVTSDRTTVYAFSNLLSPAAVNRLVTQCLSSGQDVRTYLRDKLEEAAKLDAALLPGLAGKTPATADYTDGLYVIFDQVSALLAPKLMSGKLWTGYQWRREQAQEGRYYTPGQLSGPLKDFYRGHMDLLYAQHDELVNKLGKHLALAASQRTEQDRRSHHDQASAYAEAILPMATTATAGLYASGPVLNDSITRLQHDGLQEARDAGRALLLEARQVMPELKHLFDQKAVDRQALVRETMQSIASGELPVNHTVQTEPVQLMQCWPRNELDLLADILFDYSDQSLRDIQKEISGWSYERKAAAFRAGADAAFSKAHYMWDIVCDHTVASRLQMVVDGQWQAQTLTPRHGFVVPEVIDEAGLIDAYEHSFELSLELYSRLQEAGLKLEAQYAVLHGHRTRWSVTCSAEEFRHAAASSDTIARMMQDKISEAHPLIAEAIKAAGK